MRAAVSLLVVSLHGLGEQRVPDHLNSRRETIPLPPFLAETPLLDPFH